MSTRFYSAGIFMLIGLATIAQAADPIKLSIGGKLRQFVFVTDQDQLPGENLNTTGGMTDTEVYLSGKTVLDNGIEVKATIQFEAEAIKDVNADEQYVDFSGSFGRIRVGQKEGPNAGIVDNPVPQVLLATDEEVVRDAIKPRTGVVIKDAFTFKRFADDVMGISYTSPSIGGLKIGVGYHPTTDSVEGVFDKGGGKDNNAFDVSAAYEGEFEGGYYKVAGGYFHSDSRDGATDGEKAMNFILGLAYGGWDIGGSYVDVTPDDQQDERAWEVGVAFSAGPWGISSNYFHGTKRLFSGAPIKDEVDRFVLQVAYKLARNIKIGVAGFYAEQQPAGGQKIEGAGVLGGVALKF